MNLKDKIEFNIEILPEDYIEVRGNAMASGDDAFDKECEDKILKRLEQGDIYAWCIITVKATIDGINLEGTDHLGCVSCHDFDDAKNVAKDHGMYDEAAKDLLAQIESVKKLGGAE